MRFLVLNQLWVACRRQLLDLRSTLSDSRMMWRPVLRSSIWTGQEPRTPAFPELTSSSKAAKASKLRQSLRSTWTLCESWRGGEGIGADEANSRRLFSMQCSHAISALTKPVYDAIAFLPPTIIERPWPFSTPQD